MAIFGNLGIDTVDVSTSDTTILNVSATQYERVAVSAFSLHNDGVVDISVEVFISPDATSASGDRVARIAISAGGSADVNELIGQGYDDTKYIVAKANVVGVNASLSYTGYTEGS